MGSDLRVETLYKSRNEIIDKLLNDLKSWDNTLEAGIGLIKSNQISLDRIQEINKELYNLADNVNNEDNYLGKLNLLMTEIESLTDKLKNRRVTLIDGKNQLNKKSKVVDSYISNHNDPVFINKDVE